MRGKHKGPELRYQHQEAYCLMVYQSDDGLEEEVIWNSRDGVTPFTIGLASGKSATHVRWNEDHFEPDYDPTFLDTRVFVDLTPKRAAAIAKERVDQYWDEALYPMSNVYPDKAAAIEDLMEGYLIPGAPDLITAEEYANGLAKQSQDS